MIKHHLLIVEPGTEMQKLYRAIFRSHEDEFSYQIVQCGEAALEILEHSNVDLLLLAWDLPRMLAIDVLQVLRAKNKTRSLPIVVLGHGVHPEESLDALRHGADHYQAKGFNVEELLARLRQLLTRGNPPRNFLTNLLMCFPI